MTQIAPTLGGAGDTVNARDREQFEEFMTSRWPAAPARPVTIAGRAYVAFVIPPGCQVRQLKLFDSAGHVFASTTALLPGN